MPAIGASARTTWIGSNSHAHDVGVRLAEPGDRLVDDALRIVDDLLHGHPFRSAAGCRASVHRPRRSTPSQPTPDATVERKGADIGARIQRARSPAGAAVSIVSSVPPLGEAHRAQRKGWKVNVDNLGVLFLSELVGTAMLVLLGCGVVANVALAKTKGFNGGFLMVNFGWGFAVFAGVIVAYASGAHINPAVTLGLVANGADRVRQRGPRPRPCRSTPLSVSAYIGAQLIGAIIGAVIVLARLQAALRRRARARRPSSASSRPAPAIRNYGWNLVTEIIGTFVLVFVVIGFGGGRQGDGGLAALGALPVALLVIGIGASLGGPTGYAINPARDLGPRIAHAFLPIKGKGASDWCYSWVPVVGPIIGGLLAGWSAIPLLPIITLTPGGAGPIGPAPLSSRTYRDTQPHRRRRASARMRGSHGRLRTRHRPGNDEHPRDHLRQGRLDHLDRPARARADLPEGRLGRARPARDLGQRPRGDRPGARQGAT